MILNILSINLCFSFLCFEGLFGSTHLLVGRVLTRETDYWENGGLYTMFRPIRLREKAVGLYSFHYRWYTKGC